MSSSKPSGEKSSGRRSVGKRYEEYAEKFLITLGFTILERNWQAGHKEIDLIARKKSLVVFVEVKGGRSKAFGHPAERVTKRKQEKLALAAQTYLDAKDLSDVDIRFDVITISNGELEHFPDAFSVG